MTCAGIKPLFFSLTIFSGFTATLKNTLEIINENYFIVSSMKMPLGLNSRFVLYRLFR